ncbi:MAG: hypothetical protein IIC71_12050 [Acidobacteria bacterium]|nr:hypothetical protein [Acidobacteriota bacterium]
MTKFRSLAAMLLALATFAACSSSDEVVVETTVGLTLTTLAPTQVRPSGDAATTTTTTTTTTLAVPGEIQFAIVERVAGTGGDIVVVLLDSDSYTSLTDIDLVGVTRDIIEAFPPIAQAHIVDSQAAADAVLLEDKTAAQKSELADHYFLALDDGIKVTFLGPFASFGTDILGS